MIRPDLAIFSAGFLLLLLGRELLGAQSGGADGGRRRFWGALGRAARLVLAAAAVPGAYQVFRMGYFAAVVPNTALAKEAGAARWDQGWKYLADFAGPYWLWIPAAPLLVWWLLALWALARRGRWWSLACAAVPAWCGLLHAAFVVRVGGDFMHGRMLLPGYFALLLPVAVVAGRRWWHAALPALVVVPWAVVCALWLRPPYAGLRNGVGPQGIADERRFYVDLSQRRHPITLEDYAAAHWVQDGWALRALAEQRRALLPDPERLPAPPDHPLREMALASWVQASVAANRGSIGLTGYAAGSRVHIVDRLGLADPLASRLRLERRGRPGHEKLLPPTWIVARFAGLEPGQAPGAEAGDDGAAVAAVAAARAALACGDLAALRQAVEAPLTPARFIRNVALAWRLSALRLPADPTAARDELCGHPA